MCGLEKAAADWVVVLREAVEEERARATCEGARRHGVASTQAVVK